MVFFDIGGVMYDDTIYARAMTRALRELGATFTDEEFDDVYRGARAAQSGSFRRLLARRFLGPEADMAALEAAGVEALGVSARGPARRRPSVPERARGPVPRWASSRTSRAR